MNLNQFTYLMAQKMGAGWEVQRAGDTLIRVVRKAGYNVPAEVLANTALATIFGPVGIVAQGLVLFYTGRPIIEVFDGYQSLTLTPADLQVGDAPPHSGLQNGHKELILHHVGRIFVLTNEGGKFKVFERSG